MNFPLTHYFNTPCEILILYLNAILQIDRYRGEEIIIKYFTLNPVTMYININRLSPRNLW